MSIEKNASDAAAYLRAKGVRQIDGLYGVSMGGASAMRFLAAYAPALPPEGQAPAAPGWNPEDSPGLVATAIEDIPVEKAIIDAGITPYPVL